MKKTSTNLSTTSPATSKSAAPSHEEIEQRAHELWIQDGCPVGRSVYHWHEAERQLLQSKQKKDSVPQSSPRPTEEPSLAPLTHDSSPYDGLEKDKAAGSKNSRDLAKKR